MKDSKINNSEVSFEEVEQELANTLRKSKDLEESFLKLMNRLNTKKKKEKKNAVQIHSVQVD